LRTGWFRPCASTGTRRSSSPCRSSGTPARACSTRPSSGGCSTSRPISSSRRSSRPTASGTRTRSPGSCTSSGRPTTTTAPTWGSSPESPEDRATRRAIERLDSVALGEDGPTHQPVEHYAALRAIPNFWFVRPADATETVGAWKVALEREDGPVGLALSRQKLPTLEGTRRDGVARGAYVVWEAEESNGLPDLILIASGSEVALSIDAAKQLGEQGVQARVVSMPCWDLFAAQPADYREEVLPRDVKPRLSVEAGGGPGWK